MGKKKKEFHTAEDIELVVALMELDSKGNKKPLTDLLRSDCALTAKGRHYLADLIERGVAKPTHRPRMPSYTFSKAEGMLLGASFVARVAVSDGVPVKQAIDAAAATFGLDPDKLDNHYKGKRGATRRHKLTRP